MFVPLTYNILTIFDDNSSKTQDILSKLVSFDSIRSPLPVDIKNMYLCLKNNILFSVKRRLSCHSNTEYNVLAIIDDSSLKIQDICPKLVSFDSILLTL